MPKRSKKKKSSSVIVPIESEDKKGLDPNPPQDHPCSMPAGSRIALCAPPGHGKTACAKMIALYSRPFAAVFVIHGAGAFTKEWAKVKHVQTNFKEATKDYWAAQSKKHGGLPLLIICDDMNWQDLNPKERSNAYAMVQFVCTHFNATAIMCCHSWVGLTARMRRACNVVALWPPTLGGADQTAYIARSLGIGKADLDAAFRECKGKYQSLVFYPDPPPGRSTIMIDWSRPFELPSPDEDEY